MCSCESASYRSIPKGGLLFSSKYIYIYYNVLYTCVCVIVCHFIWNKHVSLLLGVDKSTLLWSASPIPSSSMFSGACYPERALEYICAARRSVDPSLPPLTDSNLWLRTFSVAQCFRCIVQETPSFGHLIMSSYRMGCNKQNGNLLVTGLQWENEDNNDKTM